MAATKTPTRTTTKQVHLTQTQLQPVKTQLQPPKAREQLQKHNYNHKKHKHNHKQHNHNHKNKTTTTHIHIPHHPSISASMFVHKDASLFGREMEEAN